VRLIEGVQVRARCVTLGLARVHERRRSITARSPLDRPSIAPRSPLDRHDAPGEPGEPVTVTATSISVLAGGASRALH